MFDLTGRKALATGAGQGVGAGIARGLANAGATLAINDLQEERASTIVGEIEAAGGKAIPAVFDVSDYDAVTAGISAVESAIGELDILINNAGIPEGMGGQQFRETEPEAWRKYIDVNLYGVMNCARAVVNDMCERGYGRSVTISSGAGTVGLNLVASTWPPMRRRG